MGLLFFPRRLNFSLVRTLMHTAWIKPQHTWAMPSPTTTTTKEFYPLHHGSNRSSSSQVFCTTSAGAPAHRSTHWSCTSSFSHVWQEKLTSNNKWQGWNNCTVQTDNRDLNSSWMCKRSSDTLSHTHYLQIILILFASLPFWVLAQAVQNTDLGIRSSFKLK